MLVITPHLLRDAHMQREVDHCCCTRYIEKGPAGESGTSMDEVEAYLPNRSDCSQCDRRYEGRHSCCISASCVCFQRLVHCRHPSIGYLQAASCFLQCVSLRSLSAYIQAKI